MGESPDVPVKAPAKAGDVKVTSTEVTVTDPAPEKLYRTKDVISTYAKKHHGGNDTDAGKAVRAKWRGWGQDRLCEIWPQYKASGKQVNPPDNNSWPKVMPLLVAQLTMQKKSRDAEQGEIITDLL